MQIILYPATVSADISGETWVRNVGQDDAQMRFTYLNQFREMPHP